MDRIDFFIVGDSYPDHVQILPAINSILKLLFVFRNILNSNGVILRYS